MEEDNSKFQYVAGFVDGDGCVQMALPTAAIPHPCPFVSFSQSHNDGEPPELVHIQQIFGGTIHLAKVESERQRKQWHMTINSTAGATRILECISAHGIVKRKEADIALDYLRSGRTNPREAAIAIRAARNREATDVDSSRLTNPYVAGLFVAEGSVGLWAKKAANSFELQAGITKKGCMPLLHAIQAKYGFGKIIVKRIAFSCGQTSAFLESIYPHMPDSQKKPQVEEALRFVATRTSGKGYKRTQQEAEHMQEIAKRLKMLKKT